MVIIDKTSEKGYDCIRIEDLSIIHTYGVYEVAYIDPITGTTIIYVTKCFFKLYKFVEAYLDY